MNFKVDIAVPEVFVGGLLGSMLIFLFSAWACAAVGRTAQEVVNEVRRQFIERPGIMVSVRHGNLTHYTLFLIFDNYVQNCLFVVIGK